MCHVCAGEFCELGVVTHVLRTIEIKAGWPVMAGCGMRARSHAIDHRAFDFTSEQRCTQVTLQSRADHTLVSASARAGTALVDLGPAGLEHEVARVHEAVVARDVRRVRGGLGGALRGHAGGGVVDEVLAEHAAVGELAALQGDHLGGREGALGDLALDHVVLAHLGREHAARRLEVVDDQVRRHEDGDVGLGQVDAVGGARGGELLVRVLAPDLGLLLHGHLQRAVRAPHDVGTGHGVASLADRRHADGADAGGRRGADHEARGEGTGDSEPARREAARVSKRRGQGGAGRRDEHRERTAPRRWGASRAGDSGRHAVAVACACERASRCRARRPCWGPPLATRGCAHGCRGGCVGECSSEVGPKRAETKIAKMFAGLIDESPKGVIKLKGNRASTTATAHPAHRRFADANERLSLE
eukprot:scaffold28078_cov57-Phaeocystis_antarctica.AAC.7